MLFLRIFQHLLPRAAAWKITIEKHLRDFFEGLSEQPAVTRTFADQVYEDLFPTTTRELDEWEKHYGLSPTSDATDLQRRQALAAEWRAGGGQSPDYIEGVLQTAGFPVYVHDWWSSGPPYVARDPRNYTTRPLVGTYRCGSINGVDPVWADGPTCSNFAGQPRCNNFLNNDPHYLVNKDLTQRAPPPIPSDPNTWPYFMYVGGQTFPNYAVVDVVRRDEFQRLLLKLRPTHLWIVTLVDYTALAGSHLLTQGGDFITTEGADRLVV